MDSISKFNLVIPMAGNGQRFKDAGYKDPKPFIDINGRPMIIRVLDNFKDLFVLCNKIILICKIEHKERLNNLILYYYNKIISEKFIIYPIEKVTEGAACTVLYSYELINSEHPLIIANSDQIVETDLLRFYIQGISSFGSSIIIFREEEQNKKWSYAEVLGNRITLVAEKRPISKYATAGIYLFESGLCFISAAVQMIIQNDRTNNEFYLCPVYNYLSSKIGYFEIEQKQMHGLGTPEDLALYLGDKGSCLIFG